MDALVFTGVAMAVLWWTDIIGFRLSVRHRRKVATLLESIPTFRFGNVQKATTTAINVLSTSFRYAPPVGIFVLPAVMQPLEITVMLV